MSAQPVRSPSIEAPPTATPAAGTGRGRTATADGPTITTTTSSSRPTTAAGNNGGNSNVFTLTTFENTDALDEREHQAREERARRDRERAAAQAEAKRREKEGGNRQQQQQHTTSASPQQPSELEGCADDDDEGPLNLISSMSRAHGGEALPIYRDADHPNDLASNTTVATANNNNTKTNNNDQPEASRRDGGGNQQDGNNTGGEDQQQNTDGTVAAPAATGSSKQSSKKTFLYRLKKYYKRFVRKAIAFLFYLHFGDRAKERQFVVFNNQNDIEGTVAMALAIGGSGFYFTTSYYGPQKWSFYLIMPLMGLITLIRVGFILYGRIRQKHLHKELVEAERDEVLEADPQTLAEALRIAAAAAEDPAERERERKKAKVATKVAETAQERRARRRRMKQLEDNSPTPAQLKKDIENLQYHVAMWNERLVYIFISINNVVCFLSYPNKQYCVKANDPIPNRDCKDSFWMWPGVYAAMLLYLFVSLPRLMPVTWLLVLSHTLLYILGRWLDTTDDTVKVYLSQIILGVCICFVALTFLLKSEEMRREMFVAIARVERYKVQTHELQGRLIRHTAACVSKGLARQVIAARGGNCSVTVEGTVVAVRMAQFTEWCSRNSGREISFHLRGLFAACDRAALKSNVNHIATFGDLYVVVAGLEGNLTPLESAECGCVFGAALLSNRKYSLRIAIASGPINGVVASNPIMYNLFGATVADMAALTSNEKPDVTLCAQTRRLVGAETIEEVVANITARDSVGGADGGGEPQKGGGGGARGSTQPPLITEFAPSRPSTRQAEVDAHNASTSSPANNTNTQTNNTLSRIRGTRSMRDLYNESTHSSNHARDRNGTYVNGGGGGAAANNNGDTATINSSAAANSQTHGASGDVEIGSGGVNTIVVSNNANSSGQRGGGANGSGQNGSASVLHSAGFGAANNTVSTIQTAVSDRGSGLRSNQPSNGRGGVGVGGGSGGLNKRGVAGGGGSGAEANNNSSSNNPHSTTAGGGGMVTNITTSSTAGSASDTRAIFTQVSGERYYVYTDLQLRLERSRANLFRTRWQISLHFKDEEIEDCFVRDVNIRVGSSSAVVAGAIFFLGLSLGCLVLLFVDIHPYEYRPATTFSAAMFTASTFCSSFMLYCVRRLKVDNALLLYFGLMLVWQAGLASSPPGMLTNNLQVWSMVLYLISYMLLPPGVITTIWWVLANGLIVCVPMILMTVSLGTFAVMSTIVYHIVALLFLAYMHLTQEYGTRGRFLDTIFSYFLAKSLQAETLVLHQQLQIPSQALMLLNDASTVNIPRLNKDDTDPLNMYGGGGRLRMLDLELNDIPVVHQGVDETAIFVMQLMDSRGAAAALGRKVKRETGVTQSAYLLRLCYAICDDAISKLGEGCVFRAKQYNGLVVLATLRDNVPAVGRLARVVQDIYVRLHELRRDVVMTCTLAAGNVAAAIVGDDFLSFEMYGDTLQTALRVVGAAPPGSLTCSDRFYFIYECWQEEQMMIYDYYYEEEAMMMNGGGGGNAEGVADEGLEHEAATGPLGGAVNATDALMGPQHASRRGPATDLDATTNNYNTSYAAPQQAAPANHFSMPGASVSRASHLHHGGGGGGGGRKGGLNASTSISARRKQAMAAAGASLSMSAAVQRRHDSVVGGGSVLGGQQHNHHHHAHGGSGSRGHPHDSAGGMGASMSRSYAVRMEMQRKRAKIGGVVGGDNLATPNTTLSPQLKPHYTPIVGTASPSTPYIYGNGVGGGPLAAVGGVGGAPNAGSSAFAGPSFMASIPPSQQQLQQPHQLSSQQLLLFQQQQQQFLWHQQGGGGGAFGDSLPTAEGLSTNGPSSTAFGTTLGGLGGNTTTTTAASANTTMVAMAGAGHMIMAAVGGGAGAGGTAGSHTTMTTASDYLTTNTANTSNATNTPNDNSPAAGGAARGGGGGSGLPGVVATITTTNNGGGGTTDNTNTIATVDQLHQQQQQDANNANATFDEEVYYEDFVSPFEIHDPMPWKLRGRGVVAIRYVSVYSYEDAAGGGGGAAEGGGGAAQ